jgi:hypothetical protein
MNRNIIIKIAVLCTLLLGAIVPGTSSHAQTQCTIRLDAGSKGLAAPSPTAKVVKDDMKGAWTTKQVIQQVDGSRWAKFDAAENAWVLLNGWGRVVYGSNCTGFRYEIKKKITADFAIPTPKPLKMNEDFSVTLTNTNTKVVYEFEGKRGDAITVTLQKGGGNPISLSLYNAALVQLALSVDSSTATTTKAPILEGTLPADGKYKVLISSFVKLNNYAVVGTLRLVAGAANIVMNPSGFVDATALSGKLLAPISNFLFIENGWAFLYDRTLALQKRTSDNALILSNKPSLAQAAATGRGFVVPGSAIAGEYVIFLQRFDKEQLQKLNLNTNANDLKALGMALLRKFAPNQATAKTEFKTTALAQGDWLAALVNSTTTAFVHRLEDDSIVFKLRLSKTRPPTLSQQTYGFDMMDSMSSAGFPILTNRQRIALGLPPQRADVDAPTLSLNIPLGNTLRLPGFTISYPNSAGWSSSNATTSPDPIASVLAGSTGTVGSIKYTNSQGKTASISIFRPPAAFIFPSSFWLDITTLGSAGLGVTTSYEVERAFVGDTLLTIIRTKNVDGSALFRVDIRPVVGGVFTLLVRGDVVDTVIAKDVILAIAGSLKSS